MSEEERATAYRQQERRRFQSLAARQRALRASIANYRGLLARTEALSLPQQETVEYQRTSRDTPTNADSQIEGQHA